MDKTSLGDRMKGYEAVPQNILMKRTPVIIRLDGKAFHTFTKRKAFKQDDSPFSDIMSACMIQTAMALTRGIQGAAFTYSQSDELSILLRDWATFDTQQWFGGKIQKIVSISASMASHAFYRGYEPIEKLDWEQRPLFDSRVFNLPFEEVTNYFIWRQQDAMRNSVNMLGQFHFSHKELHGKKIQDVKDMLESKGISWDDIPIDRQRGFCVSQTTAYSSFGPHPDQKIPIFTEDREYVEKWLTDYDGEMR